MRRITALTLVISLFVVATTACGGRTAPTATPDTQATVKAAIAGTSTAQSGTQATIDAAVQATSEAQASVQATADAAVQATVAAQVNVQATIDAAVQATVAAVPTPTPSAAYVTMTEEELAALID